MKIFDKNCIDNSRILDYDNCNIPRCLEFEWRFQINEIHFNGIMVTEVVSNKPDGKERSLREEFAYREGRFLKNRRHVKMIRWLTVTVLLAWDGLLLYMIVECLIEPVYGAAFVAGVSVYLGIKL